MLCLNLHVQLCWCTNMFWPQTFMSSRPIVTTCMRVCIFLCMLMSNFPLNERHLHSFRLKKWKAKLPLPGHENNGWSGSLSTEWLGLNGKRSSFMHVLHLWSARDESVYTEEGSYSKSCYAFFFGQLEPVRMSLQTRLCSAACCQSILLFCRPEFPSVIVLCNSYGFFPGSFSSFIVSLSIFLPESDPHW